MKYAKPKLPRKRKKAAIKNQGRKWYYETIELWKVDVSEGTCDEPICKFWVNASVKWQHLVLEGHPCLIPIATKFW